MYGKRVNKWVLKIAYVVVLLLAMTACKNDPQPVHKLSDDRKVDSVLMAKLQFNQRMVDAADKQCVDYVTAQTETYAQDDLGFWYRKTLKTDAATLQTGEIVDAHVQVSELNGNQLVDLKQSLQVGDGNLPISITRILKMMARGEQMQLVCPWYTAFGVEGTNAVKPYTNVKITISIDE